MYNSPKTTCNKIQKTQKRKLKEQTVQIVINMP
jgi:hypothetical protein